MALFFDGAWFDERLTRLGLSRATLAAALGLSQQEIVELWKDQRELSLRDVRIVAALLNASGEEVASRAGISTPAPPPAEPTLGEIAQRLARIEQVLAELIVLVRAGR
jgi:transcriptional regulator with XRE-family HTH domain